MPGMWRHGERLPRLLRVFNGLPDGSLLFVTRIEPDQYFATRPQVPAQVLVPARDRPPRLHGQARQRLEARHVPLPDVLTARSGDPGGKLHPS